MDYEVGCQAEIPSDACPSFVLGKVKMRSLGVYAIYLHAVLIQKLVKTAAKKLLDI